METQSRHNIIPRSLDDGSLEPLRYSVDTASQYIYIYIYIYIVLHRQTVSLYHNSSVWLDT